MFKFISAVSKALFGKWPFCARLGGFAGLLIGVMDAFALAASTAPLTNEEAFRLSLLFGAAAFLVTLLVYGVWLRFGVKEIFLPLLLITLVTAFFATYLNKVIGQVILAWFVGFVSGALWGWLLCVIWCGGRFNPGSPTFPVGGRGR